MKRIPTMVRVCAGTVITLVLAACSGGGSVDIGGGQQADPGSVDFPIAYVKRTIPMEQDDVRQQRDALPNADLYMRSRASPSSTEIDITGRITGDTDLYDIKDVDVSQDGRRIVFAMRGPLDEDQDEIDPPHWQIWEYDIPGDTLRRVIASDVTAAEGHDVGPQYLPDGRILFASTRQRQSQAILRDEGKPGFEAQVEQGRSESAFLLHVMDGDGGDIHQITFNQSHDLWPSVLDDGRVLFTRWDGTRGMHLYTANPDGTGLQLLYGARQSSHNTGTPGPNGPTAIQFTRPREMQDGRILTLVRPFTDSDLGGDLALIDARTYVEYTQPLAAFAGSPGPGHSRATPNEVTTVSGPSPGGRFRSAFPLWDGSNRLLVSWSLCRLLDTQQAPAAVVPCTNDRLSDPAFASRYTTAAPLYSAFIFDPDDNTFRPLFSPQEGVMITDLVAAQPRPPQAYIPDRAIPGEDFDPALVGEGLGLLEIRNVYDFDGALRNTGTPAAASTAMLADPALRNAAGRPARFLRIEKAVSIGDDDLGFPDLTGQAFGVSNFMREIIGYAPIEPDGSVSVRVPANVAFVVTIVDGDARRLFTPHRAWLQLRPGEVRRCNGCHQATQERSHGRDGSSNPADPAWGAVPGAPFPNTLPLTAANALPGDTMAQARARTSCVTAATCSQRPHVNVMFEDVWTDPVAAGRPADDPFALTYGSPGLSTPAPVRSGCINNWDSTCRVVINYVRHIQPMWVLDRGANTCTSCHARTDAGGLAQVPAGQLDLGGDPSPEQQLHVVSYRELFFADNVEDLIGGAVTDRLIDVQVGTDPETGTPIIEQRPVAASRPLTVGNARGSTRFFNCFSRDDACRSGDADAPSGTVNHNGLLTPSELRLISEWVDIGAQYFNNPFDPDVPLND